MANDLGIAGLTVDVAGAVLLLRGLAFQPARRYAEENPGPLYPRSANPKQDLAHAQSAAEAVVGATLLALGFVAQLLGNGIVRENDTSEALIYAGLVLALGGACLFCRSFEADENAMSIAPSMSFTGCMYPTRTKSGAENSPSADAILLLLTSGSVDP